MGFVADIVGDAVGAVGDLVGGAVNAVEQIPVVGDVVKGGMDLMHSLGPVGTLASSFLLPGSGLLGSIMGDTAGAVVYDASGMAIDAASVASGATELAGGVAYASAADAAAGVAMSGTAAQAAAGVAQAAGGSSMSSVLSGAKTLGSVASIGSNLYQAYNGLTNTQTPGQAQTSADPYSPYRGQAAAQLNQLVANPSSLTSGAGYQSGLNAALTGTQRQLAQTGQSQSGMGGYNMALTSGDYFNQQYNQQYNRLAQLSGASQAPALGQTANAAQQALQAKSQASSLSYLNAGIGGIQDLMKSYWG